MYNNIGGKIKSLAEILCILGIIACVLIGMNFRGAISLFIIIVGSIASWVGSFFMYGFGELIEKVSTLSDDVDDIRRSVSNVSFLLHSTENDKSSGYDTYDGERL